MVALNFKIIIFENPSKIWTILWEPKNYTKWTSEFCEGSYYKVENFQEGEKIHLLSPNGNGLFSILHKVIENQYLAFKHIGIIENFQEQPIDEETQKWSGYLETYELKSIKNNQTELIIYTETDQKYVDFMKKTFPLALEKIKKMAEK